MVDEVSIETDDQLTTLATTELDGMQIDEKRTYFELRKLRELPRIDRHLFWEEREENFSYYPLPDQPEPQLQLRDDESASFTSGPSYSSSTTNDPTNLSQSQSLVSALTPVHKLKAIRDGVTTRGVTEKRAALTPLDHEIRIVQYIQAQKRKTFNENCILTAHGVRVLPSYLKRPAGEPGCRSLEEQAEEDNHNRRENVDWGDDYDETVAVLSPVRKIRFNMNGSSSTIASTKPPTVIRSSFRGANTRTTLNFPAAVSSNNSNSLPIVSRPTPRKSDIHHSPSHKKLFQGHHMLDQQEDIVRQPLIQPIASSYSYSEERLRKEHESFLSMSKKSSSRPTTAGDGTIPATLNSAVKGAATATADPVNKLQQQQQQRRYLVDDGSIGGRINNNAIRSLHNSWL